MSDFALGQRWISDSESDLGLGTIVAINGRRISMLFPATAEQREYVIGSAPLTRVSFNVGDKVESAEGWSLTVAQVVTEDGVNIYLGKRDDTGEIAQLIETRLNHHLKFNKPQDRLFTGQIDRNDWYSLRYDSLRLQHKYQTHPLVGLAGARTSLIPHQLHIAKEAGQRVAPRVLLSDEVGLGKTIEAGMIIHQQLLTGRSSRVFILLPESLQYQWLVEMLRRFNLKFAIFDEERCAEYDSSDENPFETEQLIIAPLSLLSDSDNRLSQALAAHWDLVVVDEAHHLKWSENEASAEYTAVEKLAARSAGLLLLTATPDQLGHESHFARLRLLDSDRFHSYQSFVEEESGYQAIAELAKTLVTEKPLTKTELAQLANINALSEETQTNINSSEQATREAARQKCLKSLIDQHGTGRVLFRNTRASVKGFPKRCVLPVKLDMPAEYKAANDWWLNRHSDEISQNQVSEKIVKPLLTPEFLYESAISEDIEWWRIDPRVDWLSELVKENKNDKFLIICAKASTALTLEQAIRVKQGINASVFHEGMSIVERDRAAAWFADQEEGCQLLICSEIGSEGRNFQFARHLVLFDLPLNPDLLEQRIGRLDRIGQKHDIQIHLPYFESSASETIFQWQHQGINAYAQTCPAGIHVYEQQKDSLLTILAQNNHNDSQLAPLVEQARIQIAELNQQMEQGRDILLEINSKGFDGDEIKDQIEAIDDDTELVAFMLQVFDVYGVAQEDKGDRCLAVNPTDHMLEPHFPELSDDGMTVSFERDAALSREDVRFISWDHPMVQGCFEMINSGEMGNNTVSVLNNKALPEGTYLVELIYVVETSAPKSLQPGRFLPPTPVRILMDKAGNNLAAKVSFENLNKQLKPVGRQVGSQLATALQTQIHELIGKSETAAQQATDQLINQAVEKIEQELGEEFQRLTSLAKVNPNIRAIELETLANQQAELIQHIKQARFKFDALRLIIVSHQA
ncbi:RNA polymerase-associated protein RapA [Catenovulum sp. 2E275]|uniref:RNA polymerase-associated protein RapA n=1 Tax=Catenovulum sp. 2E275 TaxID=2980497 RepID=UPI0021D1E7F0|nr:RNA polymerase-associated protein RapA [Catenovulum sp. 2E275]MCU4677426.1 RNA polymerase-associated protein RapA [Catenovulum sp. 2E275]